MAPSVKGLICLCVAASCLLVATVALADGAADAAARAHDEGAAALREGNSAAAARAFAEADRIAPHPTTLAEALRAALDADNFDLVRILVTRAASRESTPDLTRLLAEAHRVLPVPVAVVTPPAPATLQLEAPAFCIFSGGLRTLSLPAGMQQIAVRCPDASGTTMVPFAAGGQHVLHVDYTRRRGPPLFVPVAAGGLAFVSLFVGILRGSYAGDRSAELKANNCISLGSDDCRSVARGGHAAQVQANVAFAVAGVFGAAAIGTWIWHRRASLSFAPGSQRASLQMALQWD